MAMKLRVRDLADELDVTNKDIMQRLRDLGVQAKSHMTVVEPEDAERLREAMASEAKDQGNVVQREVQPGVIVRRRRRPARKAKAEEAPAEEPEAAAEEAEAKPEEVPVEEAPVEEAAAEAPAETPDPQVARKVEPEELVAQAAEQAEQAEPEAPAAEEPEAEAPAEEPQPEAEAPAEEPPAEEAAPEAAPEAEAPAEEAEAEAKPKKAKKKAKKDEDGPQVRVISRPEKLPEPEIPEPKIRPADGAEAPGAPAPGQPAPGKRGKRKKDRRVVEFRRDGRNGFDRGGPGPVEHTFRGRGRRKKGRQPATPTPPTATQPIKAAKRKIRIDETIRLSDMAKQMGIKAQEIIKALFNLGVMATINQALDMDTATLVANEFGYEVTNVSFDEQEFLMPETGSDAPEQLLPRPPVVTIMGHVDHGKTSLLDAIRKTNITAGEAGGITQHIGAYHVKTGRGEVVFLDTPGHEAFTTMRARGAQVTDIVILVVAADDGVMDQTREAINHSRAAGVPIVVAVNKIDKPDANPDNVKRELAELDLVPEDWGGETIFANVSAKEHKGLDELLEMVLLQAEVLELKANPDKPGRGHIVEAKLDKGRGPVGTVLINEGTLHQGDSFVCGVFHGKVRALFNDQGKKIKQAGPAMPVEVQGFDGVPEAGDELVAVADDKVAKRIAQTRLSKQREKELAGKSKVTLESFLAAKPTDEEAQTLNLVIKADVQGSLEAVSEALNKLSTDEVKINIVHGGAGAINESDILLANASQAIIIGFNVRPTAKIKEVAEQEDVEIRFYDIIYKLTGDIKDAMSGMLAPDIEEVYLGQAEVRDTFSVPKVGTVAGCHVADGKLTRNAKVRLLRDGVVIYTGALSSLKRFKDDVKEVAKGYECGAGLERFNDIKVGDIIEAFEEKEVARTID